MAGVRIDFDADPSRFSAGIRQINDQLTKLESSAYKVGFGIGRAFALIGTAVASAGMVEFTKTVVDGLNKLDDLSKSTGINASRLAGLGIAAKRSGTDLEKISHLITTFTQNVGRGQKEFEKLGITAKDPLEAFKQIADVSNAIKDPMQRNAVLTKAFGDEWRAAAPLLAEGSAGIARLVEEGEKASGVTDKAAAEAAKFNSELEEMKSRVGGVAVAIVGDFLPAMNSVLGKLQTASKTNFFGFLSSSSEEEQNAQRTIDELKKKVGSLNKLREELTAPTLANKLNNGLLGRIISGGVTDVEAIDAQIAGAQKKIEYLQGLVKKSESISGGSNTKAPSATSINDFLGSISKSRSKAVDAAKKAALEQEKIFQHEIDAELKAFNEYHKNRERIAKEAQEALDGLMKEGRNLQLSVDPMARMNAEVERYNELLKAGAINQQTFDLAVAKSAADLERATSGNVEKLKFSVDSASEHMNAVLIGFQTNVQRNLGDTLFRSLSGDFDNIGDAWKTMLLRMASDAAAANLANMIFGADGTGGSGLLGKGLSLLGSVLGLFGGGGAAAGTASYTGYGGLGAPRMFAKGGIVDSPTPFRFADGGAFRSGLMGEAGPEAIMPLKRDSQGRLGVSAQGRSGGGVVLNQTINVDSRTDRAEVYAIVSRAVKNGNAELVDRLNRQGVI